MTPCPTDQQLQCQAEFARQATMLQLIREDLSELRTAVIRQSSALTEVRTMIRERHKLSVRKPLATLAAVIGALAGALKLWKPNGK